MLVQLSRHSNDRNLQHTATLSSLFLADLTMPTGRAVPSPWQADDIGLYREIAIDIQKESGDYNGVMCSTSQCELRSTFPNLRVANVIRIVTFYTLPPLESPTSSWMTRSQRSRRCDKGLWRAAGPRLGPGITFF